MSNDPLMAAIPSAITSAESRRNQPFLALTASLTPALTPALCTGLVS